MKTELTVAIDEVTTPAVYESAKGDEVAVFVCGHGAGGNMHDRGVLAAANAMRKNGIGVVRFDFLPWRGRDPMPKLTKTFAAVVARVRSEIKPARLIIGGRSMGGRAASMMAADGFDADGLLLLAYPLHPDGQPEKLRDAHLPRIRMRTICFSGTRDPLCTRSLMEKALESVTAPWDMHWIEGADHSFHVLKSSGTTDAEVMERIGTAAGAWANRLGGKVQGVT
jgi:predicted alpha/beta-hydrolase family hydrolase